MEKKYELKNLTFSKYNIQNFDDVEKNQYKTNGKRYLNLYDNKPLKLKIKAFCGIIKCYKSFRRNRNVKIVNGLASAKIYEVFSEIHCKISSK